MGKQIVFDIYLQVGFIRYNWVSVCHFVTVLCKLISNMDVKLYLYILYKYICISSLENYIFVLKTITNTQCSTWISNILLMMC